MAAGLTLTLILLRHLDGIDWARIRAAVAGFGIWQWTAALAATAVSYWAIGQYDLAMHRHLRTGTAAATALRAGRVAIALGQLLGFGPLVGSLARWRMLPGIGPRAAMGLSAPVSLSFIAAMTVVVAASVTISDLPLPAPLTWAALAIAALCPALIVCCAVAPDNPASRFGRMVPGVAVVLRILAFTCIDLAAAGAALWLFLPAGTGIPPADFMAAFLIATLAGLILSTPGGIGTFELLMIALLPAAESRNCWLQSSATALSISSRRGHRSGDPDPWPGQACAARRGRSSGCGPGAARRRPDVRRPAPRNGQRTRRGAGLPSGRAWCPVASRRRGDSHGHDAQHAGRAV